MATPTADPTQTPPAPSVEKSTDSSPGDAQILDEIFNSSSNIPDVQPEDLDQPFSAPREPPSEPADVDVPPDQTPPADVEVPPQPAEPGAPAPEEGDDPNLVADDILPSGVEPEYAPVSPEEPSPAPEPEPTEDLSDAAIEKRASELKLDEQQRHAFTQLGFDKRELRREVAEMKEKMKGLEEAPPAASEGDLVKANDRVQELETLVGQLDLSRSPAFQRQFDIPINESLARIKNIMVRSGIEDTEAHVVTMKAFQMSDLNQRIQFLSEEAPALHGPLIAIFEQIETLKEQRGQALVRWKETRAADSERERQDRERLQFKAVDEVSALVFQSLENSKDFLFNRQTSDATWNDAVKERFSAIKGVLQKREPSEIAMLVSKGVAYHRLTELYRAEREARKRLQESVAKTIRVTPGLSAAQTPGTPPAQTESRSDDEILAGVWGESRAGQQLMEVR